jgi:phage portal protein BeeE
VGLIDRLWGWYATRVTQAAETESARFTQRGVDPSGASVLMTSYSAFNGNEGPSLVGDNRAAYSGNSVVFGAILARMSLFSEATFAFRDLADKHLSGAFEVDGRRNTALRKLENPWPNGTTGELLARMIQDADLAGNAYVWDAGEQLVRLRPDWITIVSELSTDGIGRPYRQVVGYYYEPPMTARKTEGEPQYFTVDEVAHWSPNPDPEANFRGMSWLTPVLREVWADNAMTNYKIKYLENAASPNLLIRYSQRLGQDTVDNVKARIEARHGGVDNAFRTLVLDEGADVTVIGNTFEQMNFSTVQAAGENRIIIASGVPGIVIGSKEGLMAAPQPLDAKILTPVGWSTMGEMEVGSQVIGRDGKAHDVTGVYPKGEQDIYRVIFTDGASTECTADHLWSVWTPRDRDWGLPLRSFTLAEIMRRGVLTARGKSRWSIPMLDDPVQFDEQPPLPLDPYLLGALLGDGSFVNGALAFATADDEMVTNVRNALPQGVKLETTGQPYGYRITRAVEGYRNSVITVLRDLGLWDHLGKDKFIPDCYMTGDIADRVALLQGLVDTDGNVEKSPGVGFRLSNTSERLVRQVAELVLSLGGRAAVFAEGRDRGPNGNPQWVVHGGRLPDEIIPARLTRKVADWRPAGMLPRSARVRYIASVVPVGRKQAQCIRVDASDSLYVTDDYVITHNTYSNYEQAMRRFADITMRPLWRSVCACLSKLVTVPPGTRLWFDTADIAALRQGEKERADTMLVLAEAAAALIAAGGEPDTVTAAVAAGDVSLLKFKEPEPTPPALLQAPKQLNGGNGGLPLAIPAGKVTN